MNTTDGNSRNGISENRIACRIPIALLLSIQLLLFSPLVFGANDNPSDLGSRDSNENTLKKLSAIVTKITDGDTIHAKPIGTSDTLKIRFAGIDTPELHFPGKHGVVSQGYWAEKAAEYLAKEIPVGTHVQLEIFSTDKYGRSVARVLHKRIDINLLMVQQGLAVTYMICQGASDCNSRYFVRHDVQKYVDTCREAVAQGRGFFGGQPNLPELPFEFRMRETDRIPDKWVGDLKNSRLFEPAEYPKVDLCDRIFFISKSDAKRVGFNP